MAASLRARLLLSYGMLIAVLLILFSLGALLALLRNPLVYENAAQQLRTAQRMVNSREGLFSAAETFNYDRAVRRAGERMDVRVLLLGADGAQLADSQGDTLPSLRAPVSLVRKLRQRNEIGFLRDSSNRVWLVLVQPLDDQTMVLLAVRRPPLAILEFFRSEFLRPILLTGLMGLTLALSISLLMTHWISAPLKRIGAAADEVAAGRFQAIQSEGPVEVRHLADSFNHMVQRVQDAQQSQRDLVANVSHELKTPLTSIQGFNQSILDGVSQTPEEIHQAAQVIAGEANRMNRLVQDLLALARLEAGTADLQQAPVNIGALVRATAERFRPQFTQAGVRLHVDAPDLPQLVGDEDRLAQVLSNLVDNALKFTPSGGEVRVSLQPLAEAGGVRICVTDTGVGIKPEDHARVFDRFYRSDHKRSGSGLGLAIARQIVLAHGGIIRVEDHQSQGAVFIVELPDRGG